MITLKNKTLKIHDTSTGTDVDLNAIKGDTYSLTEQDKSEIASQIHYDDSELRAEIESKENVVNKADAITDLNKDSSTKYPSNKAITDYIADGNNLPVAVAGNANGGTLGVIRPFSNSFKDVTVNGKNYLQVNPASNSSIDNRYTGGRPICVDNLDYAVKQALCDGKGAPYTEAEKKSARERIGAEGGMRLIADFTLTGDGCKTNFLVQKDINGNSFSLKQAKVLVYAPIQTDSTQTDSSGYISFGNGSTNQSSFGNVPWWAKDKEAYTVMDVFALEDYPVFAEYNATIVSIGYAQVVLRYYSLGHQKQILAEGIKTIRSVKNAISLGTGYFAEGTRVIIYGIDK